MPSVCHRPCHGLDRTLTIICNGEPYEAADKTTVAHLLQQIGISEPHIAVEVNQAVVPRADHAGYELHDGDELEVVRLVGGG